jgi:hypothetical protein
MSSDFKLEHPGGGVTIGVRIAASNGEYWSITIYTRKKEPETIHMTNSELAKYFRVAGVADDFARRVIGF